VHRKRAAFGAMEGGVFGRPATDAIDELIGRFGTARIILIVSATLNRAPAGIKNEIEKAAPGVPRMSGGPAPIRETLLLAAS
jgi:hypothetical protein